MARYIGLEVRLRDSKKGAIVLHTLDYYRCLALKKLPLRPSQQPATSELRFKLCTEQSVPLEVMKRTAPVLEVSMLSQLSVY